MEIGTLSAEAFRNLAPSRRGFHPRLNLPVGANGQGKTSREGHVGILSPADLLAGRAPFVPAAAAWPRERSEDVLAS